MPKKFKRSTLHIKNSKPLTKGSWSRSLRDGRNGKAGYVYVIQLGEYTYKIGMTGNVEKRLSNLKTSNLNAKLVLSFRMPDMKSAERRLHDIFKSRRIDREIFNLSNRDVYAAEKILTKLQRKQWEEINAIKAQEQAREDKALLAFEKLK